MSETESKTSMKSFSEHNTPHRETNATSFEELDGRDSYLLPDGRIDWETALSVNEHWIRSVIAQKVGEYSAVDEVFQEVALAAAKQSEPLRDPSKVCAWLHRLAVIQSSLYRRTMGRKRKLLKRCEENAEVQQENEIQNEPIDWLLVKERKERVRAALSRLHEDERKMLLMKYSEDKSYQEIANELGVSTSSVQSKLHRARQRLKKLLQNFMSN